MSKSGAKQRTKRSRGDDSGSESDMDVQMTEADWAEERRMDKILKNTKQHRHELIEGDQSAEDVAAYYEKRLLERGSQEDDFSDEGSTRRVSKFRGRRDQFSLSILPRSDDPKVFAVKCRNGMARLLVARLLNKWFDYRHGRNYEGRFVDLGIISVFSVDHVKEYIYIEASRENFVAKILEGLEGVFRFAISIVNPTELMQLVERHVRPEQKIEKGTIVRLRKHPYREDIAQVISVLEGGRKLSVRVIPREDFVGHAFQKQKKGDLRQPQRFFNSSLALGATSNKLGSMWGPLQFDSEGYLLMTCSAKLFFPIETMTKPSTEELAIFFKRNRDEVMSAAKSIVNEAPVSFSLGDFVRASGQLSGTVGKVIKLSQHNRAATIAVSTASGITTVDVPYHGLTKFFPDGSHVEVGMKGLHGGESGTVIQSAEDTVTILSDVSGKHIVVPSAHCHITSVSRSTQGSAHRSGSWSLFDLLMLNDGVTVCCLVGIRDDTVIVMDRTNASRQIPKSQVRQKVVGNRSAFDRLRNPCRRLDEVSIEAGVQPSLIGSTAQVEQLYNDIVFIRSNKIQSNAGLIALPMKCVRVLGARTKVHSSTVMKQLRVIERHTHPNRNAHDATRGQFEAESSATWESAPLYDDFAK